MGMPVGELLRRISSRELTEWNAFANVEPIGDERQDIRFAVLASVIANAYRDAERHPAPFEVIDFLFDWWEVRDPEEGWKKIRDAMSDVAAIQEGSHDANRNTRR